MLARCVARCRLERSMQARCSRPGLRGWSELQIPSLSGLKVSEKCAWCSRPGASVRSSIMVLAWVLAVAPPLPLRELPTKTSGAGFIRNPTV